MELCLIVQGSRDPQVRRYPLEAGRKWTAGRLTNLSDLLVDAQEYLFLEQTRGTAISAAPSAAGSMAIGSCRDSGTRSRPTISSGSWTADC
jgi:hypothetical protein